MLAEYVKVEQRWIPSISEFSLYLRPLHISMENSLGVKSPNKSKLLILGSPAGPYYPTGFEPISLSCGVGTIRSAPGGTGMYKVGGYFFHNKTETTVQHWAQPRTQTVEVTSKFCGFITTERSLKSEPRTFSSYSRARTARRPKS